MVLQETVVVFHFALLTSKNKILANNMSVENVYMADCIPA